ncbi:MAG: DNA-directed RNA polymerase subunit omega [Deltaproteobacteria bacterium]
MYVPLEKLIDKAENNMYRLVHLASARALQLADGAPRFLEVPHDLKVTTVAMLEIAHGKIRVAPAAEGASKNKEDA